MGIREKLRSSCSSMTLATVSLCWSAKITDRGVKISSMGIFFSLNKFSIISDSCSSIDPSSSPISAMAVISSLLTFFISSSSGVNWVDKASLNHTNGNVKIMSTRMIYADGLANRFQ